MEPRASAPPKGSARRMLLMIALVLALIVTAVWANLWKSDLRVREVTVEGNRIVETKSILALAGIATGQKLFDVNLFAAREKVEKNSFIRSASVNRHVPGRITITVEEREPLAALLMEKMVYVDDEGMVLPSLRSDEIFDLPVISGTLKGTEVVPGKQVISQHLKEALDVLRIARVLDDELYRRISEVHAEEGRDLLLYTAEYGVPVVLGRGDIGARLVKFDAFWEEFIVRYGASELQYVDLRFEDQVVVRWKNGPQDIQRTRTPGGESSNERTPS